jgi:hypothetical protein
MPLSRLEPSINGWERSAMGSCEDSAQAVASRTRQSGINPSVLLNFAKCDIEIQFELRLLASSLCLENPEQPKRLPRSPPDRYQYSDLVIHESTPDNWHPGMVPECAERCSKLNDSGEATVSGVMCKLSP